ncbi:unnamed protein product [Polarella glacialis]|uniref:Uncharacterized protein n=1 Tax=Polarella glacialis TaxID=89957 RepID=A0A813FK26_POLGL|nr:unnamed protein product [Polarella glacialis]
MEEEMTRTLSPEGAKPGELTSVDWYDELGIGWNEIFDQDPAAGVVGKVPGAAAAAVARDPPPRPPGGPERGAARSERKEARAPGRPAAAAAPGDGGAAPVPVPTMGERNRPKAKSKPGEAISFEVATSKIPPLYLRIGGGTKNAIERGMKARKHVGTEQNCATTLQYVFPPRGDDGSEPGLKMKEWQAHAISTAHRDPAGVEWSGRPDVYLSGEIDVLRRDGWPLLSARALAASAGRPGDFADDPSSPGLAFPSAPTPGPISEVDEKATAVKKSPYLRASERKLRLEKADLRTVPTEKKRRAKEGRPTLSHVSAAPAFETPAPLSYPEKAEAKAEHRKGRYADTSLARAAGGACQSIRRQASRRTLRREDIWDTERRQNVGRTGLTLATEVALPAAAADLSAPCDLVASAFAAAEQGQELECSSLLWALKELPRDLELRRAVDAPSGRAGPSQRRTLLQVVSARGLERPVTLLLEIGANVTLKDELGRTALHMAALRNHAEVARLLLLRGRANVEARDCKGRTALHLATDKGKKRVARVLVRFGASPSAPDGAGRSPLQDKLGRKGGKIPHRLELVNWMTTYAQRREKTNESLGKVQYFNGLDSKLPSHVVAPKLVMTPVGYCPEEDGQVIQLKRGIRCNKRRRGPSAPKCKVCANAHGKLIAVSTSSEAPDKRTTGKELVVARVVRAGLFFSFLPKLISSLGLFFSEERLLTCAATQARKPAEVMEIELDQLRAELGQAHRDKRKEAQQLRRLARRCRVKPGEDLEALEERYLAGRPLPPLTLAELLTPRCQPTESGETSARRGESKAFFMQLGRLPASDAPSSKDLWCTGSAGCACCSLPLLARARHGELSTPRALPLQP